MISHGLVSGALFLCVGVVYDRLHTREIARYGGLVNNMPRYAAVFMLFTMASVGLPGTSGFVGEILVLIGAFKVEKWTAFLAASGLILGAAYMLWLYRRVVFGDLTKRDLKKMTDLTPREITIFVPIIVLVLWLGIYPKPVLDAMHPSVEHLMGQVTQAQLASQGVEMLDYDAELDADMDAAEAEAAEEDMSEVDATEEVPEDAAQDMQGETLENPVAAEEAIEEEAAE